MSKQLRTLAILLAFVAVVSLLSAGMHVHADGSEHPNCWICLSSIGRVAIQALAISIFISWVCLGLLQEFVSSVHDETTLAAPCSRAPPVVPSF